MRFPWSWLLTFLFSYSLPLFGEVRKWTDVQGRVIEAELIKLEDGVVHIRLKSGKTGKVPLEKLSVDDQAFVKRTIQPPPDKPAPTSKPAPPQPSEEKWPNDHGINPPAPFADWVYPKGTVESLPVENSTKRFSPDGEILFDGLRIGSVDFQYGYASTTYRNPDNSNSPALIDADGNFILGGKDGATLPEGTKVLGKYGGDGLIAFGVDFEGKRNNWDHIWGYLDLKGKVVLEPKWSYAQPFVNGLAPVCVGETSIEYHPAGGAARFIMGGSYHYIDKTGTKAIDGDWKIALPFDKFGHAFVLPKSEKPKTYLPWLAIDKDGNLASPTIELTRMWSYRDERIVVKNLILDVKGNILFSAAKGTLRDCVDGSGVCIYQCGSTRGEQSSYRLVDRATGKCYGPELKYKSLEPFKEGHGVFETYDKQRGLIDRMGKVVIGPHSGHASLKNGYYRVHDFDRDIVEYWSIKTRQIFKTAKP